MSNSLPQITRTYQNHTLDSRRWDHYQPRQDDIVISTSLKSGTTWTVEIVRQLIFLGHETPPFRDFWLDACWWPLDELIAELETQHQRRYIKTHLPLDGLPFYPQVKYIVVGRDARDVFMSLWNHYTNFLPTFLDFINNKSDRVGEPLPPCQQDIHTYWREWITRGWFPWESEGYPFWGNMRHTQTWWSYRHLDNILFVHFNDLLTNLAGEIQRIANFLQIVVPNESLPTILQAVSLVSMRCGAEKMRPYMKQIWKGGAQSFYYKGMNGRWKNTLTTEELSLYKEAIGRVLTPDCARWLEQGRRVLT